MRSVRYWIGQLVPRTFWSVTESTQGDHAKRFTIWKMWLGRCYDITVIAAQVSDFRSWARCLYGPLDDAHDATWEALDARGVCARSCDRHRAKMLEEFPPEDGCVVVAFDATHKGNE